MDHLEISLVRSLILVQQEKIPLGVYANAEVLCVVCNFELTVPVSYLYWISDDGVFDWTLSAEVGWARDGKRPCKVD